MNVLILNHEFPPIGGGAATATAYIARELAAFGVNVTVLTAAWKDLTGVETCEGYRVIRVPAFRKSALESHPHEIAAYLASAFLNSFSTCRQDPPDLVHAFFGIPSGALGYALNRLTGVPYLISFRGRDVHGGKASESGGIGGLMKTLSLPVWHRAEALIANSQGLKQIAQQVDPGAEVGVIPNGIDTQKFSPAGPSHHEDRVRLLFVGRLEPYKGLADLFKAMELVQKRTDKPFSLQVVGDGSLRHSLQDLVAEMGIASRVDFLGPIPGAEMPGIYQDADVFVLPSLVEGMPNVVLEAMASGLPILATRIPGSEDLVCHRRTGALVPPSNPELLAEALYELIQNSAFRKAAGQRAREKAEVLSWKHVARAYLDLYRDIQCRHATSPVPQRMNVNVLQS